MCNEKKEDEEEEEYPRADDDILQLQVEEGKERRPPRSIQLYPALFSVALQHSLLLTELPYTETQQAERTVGLGPGKGHEPLPRDNYGRQGLDMMYE